MAHAGKYGTFIGHKDAFFAVIEATGTLGAVFHTASTNHANAVPLYTFNLDGCSIAGCAMPLFNGPPSAFQVGVAPPRPFMCFERVVHC
eukprot:scaffold85938_cov19-Tisochrysis_lutea.AAC.4